MRENPAPVASGRGFCILTGALGMDNPRRSALERWPKP